MSNNYKFETLSVHAGQNPDATGSLGIPIYKTNAYVFKDSDHAANLFALKELGYIYTRIGDPTTAILEDRLTAVEGGKATIALSSGTTAIFYTIITIAQAGDEIVSANNIYGGTSTQFSTILPTLGITTKFVDINNPENVAKAITPKTKLVFIETVGNPGIEFCDIKAIAKIAHDHGLPLVVDATFTTPALLRTIEHGADIVINSLSKWIGGHGAAIGGSVTDAGTFNWKSDKFPLFNQPDANYHGLRWAHDLPAELSPIAFALRLRTVPLRNLGACISSENSWHFTLGLETLPLRIERQSENSLAVAKFLEADKRVDWVRYPGLASDPYHAVAKKYLSKHFGGVLAFGPKGGYQAANKFINNLPLFSFVANVGDNKSLSTHPASMTHSQLTEEQLKATGVTPELIRLSIGIEHIDDILDALDKGLAASQK
ncbi:MAG: O-acetylhomoserine aminocarboxypropyltransferase/cysteine synthase family protein [Brevinema sp.]